jgi:hypothetical protein
MAMIRQEHGSLRAIFGMGRSVVGNVTGKSLALAKPRGRANTQPVAIRIAAPPLFPNEIGDVRRITCRRSTT